MTDTTPTTAPDQPPASAPANPVGDIIPPPEVSALLDEATAAGHGIVLDPTATSIRTVDSAGNLVREVQWAQAGEWSRRGFSKLAQSIAAQPPQPKVVGWPELGEEQR